MIIILFAGYKMKRPSYNEENDVNYEYDADNYGNENDDFYVEDSL